MNIYKLHSKPDTLNNYNKINMLPENAFMSIKRQKYDSEAERIKLLKVVAKDAYYSYKMGRLFGERFKMGEPTIATDAEWSYMYASDVVRGRFEQGEEAIATSAKWSYKYAYIVMRSERFLAGEHTFAEQSDNESVGFHAYLYAVDVLHEKWITLARQGDENITIELAMGAEKNISKSTLKNNYIRYEGVSER